MGGRLGEVARRSPRCGPQTGRLAVALIGPRAAEEQGDKDAARTLYTEALPGDNYYSAMAAARLGERVVPRLEPIPLDAAQVDNIAAADAFRRVRELTLTGLRDLATIEWQYGYRLLPEEQRLQAVHLAARWEIYDVAVAMATTHGRFNDYTLLYPRPHGAEVAAAAKLTDVDADLLYGVLRQESLFRSDAASAAGAFGIAQLTPATARETARRWSLPAPTRADLFDPKVGITLGAARLAELESRFGSELPLALGAYNAGEAAVARWLPPRDGQRRLDREHPLQRDAVLVRRVLWHGSSIAGSRRAAPKHARLDRTITGASTAPEHRRPRAPAFCGTPHPWRSAKTAPAFSALPPSMAVVSAAEPHLPPRFRARAPCLHACGASKGSLH
jgi:soluble lytic murein transglycosylase